MLQRILFFILPIFLCTSLTKAQDFWEIVPTPDSANLISMTIQNNGDIWLGSNGVYLSQDNGETWEYNGLYGHTIYSITTDSVNNVFAGSKSRIFKSTGAQWDLVYYGGTANFSAIECGSEGLVIASAGFEVGILRSNDYGVTWDTGNINLNMWEYIKDISISSDGIIYIGTTAYAGSGGGVYKSLDTGYNWEHIGLYEEGIKSLEFDSNNDLYVGSTGPIWGLYKKDIYDNWNLIFNNGTVTGIVVNSNDWIYLSCSYKIFIGGAYYTSDLGETWAPIHSGLISNDLDELEISPNQYVFSICKNWNTLYRSILSTVSVPDISAERLIITYPNPFYDHLNIGFNHAFKTHTILNIYDVLGNLILETSNCIINNDTYCINTSGWKPGLYILNIQNKEVNSSMKILKIQ